MAAQLKPPVHAGDHTKGTENARFEIVEYGDYQCPYCGADEPIVEEIMDTFGEDISFTFRNFPLQDVHEFAFGAAMAAEAAGQQGKYWEMHDLIFAHQADLDRNALMVIAMGLGLDLKAFETDLESAELKQKVEADFESGARSGVNGTPSFFVNGIRFDGGVLNLYAWIKENISE